MHVQCWPRHFTSYLRHSSTSAYTQIVDTSTSDSSSTSQSALTTDDNVSGNTQTDRQTQTDRRKSHPNNRALQHGAYYTQFARQILTRFPIIFTSRLNIEVEITGRRRAALSHHIATTLLHYGVERKIVHVSFFYRNTSLFIYMQTMQKENSQKDSVVGPQHWAA